MNRWVEKKFAVLTIKKYKHEKWIVLILSKLRLHITAKLFFKIGSKWNENTIYPCKIYEITQFLIFNWYLDENLKKA